MVSLKIERKLVLDSLCPCKLNNSYAKFNNIEGIRNSLHKLFEIISSAEKTSTNEYFNKDERQRCAEYYIDLWFNAEISVATLAVNNHTLHKATHFSTWIDQAQLAIKSIHGRPLLPSFQSMILRVGKDCSHTSGFCVKRIASIPDGIR